MRLRKRAVAAVFVTTAAFTAIAPQAMAAPMPWTFVPLAIWCDVVIHHSKATHAGGRFS